MTERAVPAEGRRYESYTHEAMKAEVEQGNEPSAAGELSQGWHDVTTRLHEAVEALTHVSGESEQLWQGPAGDALRGVLDDAANWSAETATVSAVVSDAITRQAEAAARAKADMPEPVPYEPAAMIRDALSTGSVSVLAGLSDAMSARAEQAEEARQRAVDVMYARDAALRDAVPRESFSAPPPLTSGPA